jgi:hypothetical protein
MTKLKWELSEGRANGRIQGPLIIEINLLHLDNAKTQYLYRVSPFALDLEAEDRMRMRHQGVNAFSECF